MNFLNDAGRRFTPFNRLAECALTMTIIVGVGSESHQILWSALIRTECVRVRVRVWVLAYECAAITWGAEIK